MFIVLVITIFIILSTSFLFFTSIFHDYFKFFSSDLWLLYVAGSLLIIISEFVKYGKMSNAKCQISHITLTLGGTIIYIPILYKLIINFPIKNSYSEFVRKKKFLLILCLIFIECFINLLLFLISPFYTKKMIVNNTDNKNFKKCTFGNKIGLVIVITQIIFKIIFFIVIFLLIFFEWRYKAIYIYVRKLAVLLWMNAFLIGILIILSFISINDYIVYKLIHISVITIFSLTNHTFALSIGILVRNAKKKNKIAEKLFTSSFESLNSNNEETFDTPLY